jgi:lysophospholipase L1-like esterase
MFNSNILLIGDGIMNLKLTLFTVLSCVLILFMGKIYYDNKIDAAFAKAESSMPEKQIEVVEEEETENLMVLGHSYVYGSNASDLNTKGFVPILSKKLGVPAINKGVGGTDINVNFPESAGNSALEKLENGDYNTEASHILVLYGVNALNKLSSGEMTYEQYQSDYTELLKKVREKHPDAVVFVSGVVSIPYWSDEELSEVNTAIENASKAITNSVFIDMSGLWGESEYAEYVDKDNVHPTDAGHQFLADKYFEVISEYK